MPVKVDNDSAPSVGNEGRIHTTPRVYQLAPRARYGAGIPGSSAAPAANMTALKIRRPSGNDDDPGPAAA